MAITIIILIFIAGGIFFYFGYRGSKKHKNNPKNQADDRQVHQSSRQQG